MPRDHHIVAARDNETDATDIALYSKITFMIRFRTGQNTGRTGQLKFLILIGKIALDRFWRTREAYKE